MKQVILVILMMQSYSLMAQTLHSLYKDLPCFNKEFKIYAHAVYDEQRTTVTEDMIIEVIEEANKYFEPICLSFSFCEMDTVFNYNFNRLASIQEAEELSLLYVKQNRINLYLITGFLFNNYTKGFCSGSVLSVENADIYLLEPGSLTHELGHFFGLLDTYKDNGLELADGSNCAIAGDKICDTPADPFLPSVFQDNVPKYVRDCIFISKETDANGDYYQAQVGNLMSAYYCKCGFTREQYLKMAENYSIAQKKHW